MGWTLPVQILGVNQTGQESGNSLIPPLSDLPWLQDVAGQNVWGTWDPAYRDVVIVDENNVWVATFNLTANNLSVPANFDSLKALIESYAQE